MFEHFTFGVQDRRSEHFSEVSPLDTTTKAPLSPPPESPLSLSDLLAHFDGQTLDMECDEISSSQWNLPTPPPESSFDFDCEDVQEVERSPLLPTLPARKRAGAMKCRRVQRQISSQLLCTVSQKRSIDTLVEEMLATQDQCTISAPIKITPFEDPVAEDPSAIFDMEDEGFFEADHNDPSVQSAGHIVPVSSHDCAMPTGIRKYSGLYGIRRAGDWAGAGVHCPPRVRRNIKQRRSSGRRATA